MKRSIREALAQRTEALAKEGARLEAAEVTIPVAPEAKFLSPVDVPRKPVGKAFEEHFTPIELAKLWKFSEDKIREMFWEEYGVLIEGRRQSEPGQPRRYTNMQIPLSVAERVHRRLRNKVA